MDDALKSHAVNPDELAARLLEVANGQRGPSPTPTIPCDETEDSRRRETNAYHRLIAEGGRPCYPLSDLEHVLEDPNGPHEALRPWQEYIGLPKPDDCPQGRQLVFRKQLEKWREFRKWQRDNRGIIDHEDESFEAFLEQRKQGYANNGMTWEQMFPDKTESQFLDFMRSLWTDEHGWREYERENYKEIRGEHAGFSKYAEAVRQRLARHGFTQPFRLAESPQDQGKLATWIEYLNFEYWWADQYTRALERKRPKREASWKRLVDAGVVPASEDFVSQSSLSDGFVASVNRELNSAKEGVASAEAENSAEKARHALSRLTTEEGERRLAAAELKLNGAKKKLEDVRNRIHLINKFFDSQEPFKHDQVKVFCHKLMARWILDQIPRIVEEDSSPSPHNQKQVERVVDSSRAERQPAETSPAPAGTASSAAKTNLRKRTRHDAVVEEPPSKRPRGGDPSPTSEPPLGPRRSVRLAAKRDAAPSAPDVAPPPAGRHTKKSAPGPPKVPPPAARGETKKAPASTAAPSKPGKREPISKRKRGAAADEPRPKRSLRKHKAG